MPAEGAGGHDFARVRVHATARPRTQATLIIGRPGDTYEQEAERIAEQVVRGDLPPAVPASTPQLLGSSRVQRQSLLSPSADDGAVVDQDAAGGSQGVAQDGQDDGQSPDVQPLRASPGPANGSRAGGAALRGWARRFAPAARGGEFLPASTRRDMEQRFQVDFADVRVHRDSEAAQLSAGIGARAFAHGAHVYFGRGEYAPDTNAGRRVLAHELAHVVQQGAARAVASGATVPARTAATVQRLPHLNRSDPSNVIRTNYAPWPHTTDPRGDEYRVSTDGGTQVRAWVAYGGYPESQRFWCHGHSLGTYASDGYSVYSGGDVKAVINDEWGPVADADTRPGDIAVAVPTFDHSALFKSVALSGSALDDNATTLSTKNGMQPLTGATLAGVKAAYPGDTFRSFRRKT